jgi:sporulation protein YlmC with PRC-barrel domain
MRASELLGSEVVDAAGRRRGRVCDVRLSSDDLAVIALVVCRGRRARLAQRLGHVGDRSAGPWLLHALLALGVRRTTVVPASDVRDWGPGEVRLRTTG